MVLFIKFTLLFINFAGWFSLLNRFLRNYSQSVILFQGLWITVGFITNFYDQLLFSFYLFQIIGYLSACYFCYDAYRKKSLSEFLPKELLILYGLCSIWFLRVAFAYYSSSDTTLNWGIVIKELLFFDGFSPVELTNNTQTRYPNGPAIYQYYFVKFLGYTEGTALLANCCLFTAFCSPFIHYSKRFSPSMLFILIMVMLAIFANPGFGSLYVDYLIGGGIAALLIIVYQNLEQPKKLLLFTPLIFAIAALKQVGLTICVLSAVFLLYVTLRRGIFNLYHLIVIILLIIIPNFTDYMWVEGFLTRISQTSISKPFLEKLQIAANVAPTEYGQKVIAGFLWAYSTFFFTRTVGLLFIILVFGSLVFIKKHASAKKYNDTIIFLQAACLMIILYGCHRLVLYLTVVDPIFSVIAASLKRYLCSLLIGILGLVLYLCKETFHAISKKEYNKFHKHIVFLLVIVIIAITGRFYKKPYLVLPEDRTQIQSEIAQIYPYLLKGKKIYILPHNFHVGDCSYYPFETTPFAKRTNLYECFNIGDHRSYKKYQATSSDLNPNKLIQQNYDLLFIPRVDKSLNQKLGHNFSNHKIHGSLFSIKNGKFIPLHR